jgi:ABC-type branched-subunit amino acid transport system substrate-binding protein
MRQHKPYTRLLAVLLGLSLVAAACGDDEDEPEAEGQEEEGQGQEQEEEPAGDDPVAALHETGDADPSCTGESNDTLSIGALLPETGDLSFLGPPMIAGANIAVEEINADGGVNGQPIEYLRGDSGDEDPAIAAGTVDGHLQNDVDVVLGAAASGISFSVIDTLVEECKVMFSPANTSPDFTTYDDDGLYFRTAPADILQGQVLAELALEDGVSTAAILARQDSYGQGLLRYIQEPFEAGGGEVVVDRSYDPEGQDFSAEVQAVLDEDPDALFMVGFQESSRIIQDLFEQGFTPDEKFIYFVDGNVGNAMGETFEQPGALVGVRGTFPSAEVGEEFSDRLHEQDPELQDEIYGPETYDAITILALAATQAGTDQPDEIARNINSVTREGTACTSFAECRDLIDEGEDIDYNGVSGALDFALPGEPTTASIAVQAYGEDNRIDPDATEYREVELPE